MLYSGKKFRQIRSECVTVALSYETESPYTACDRQNVAQLTRYIAFKKRSPARQNADVNRSLQSHMQTTQPLLVQRR